VAKKASRGKTGRKPSRTKDLPVDRKARTVKGGAFDVFMGDGSVRNTARQGTIPGITSRNTI